MRKDLLCEIMNYNLVLEAMKLKSAEVDCEMREPMYLAKKSDNIILMNHMLNYNNSSAVVD